VDAFGDENVWSSAITVGLAVVKNRSQSWCSSVARAARGTAASVTGWP
jgi:hypothetical protein